MEEQQERPYDQTPAAGGGTDDSGSGLTALRADTDAMLAASDEILKKSLSGNSEAFLKANKQAGGQ